MRRETGERFVYMDRQLGGRHAVVDRLLRCC